GHYEGRGWRGFHHHATLCIAAYGFLIAERARFSPSGPGGAGGFEAPRLPEGYQPRGAPIRPERHVPNSIATVRRRLTVAIAQTLQRCPCSHASTTTDPHIIAACDAVVLSRSREIRILAAPLPTAGCDYHLIHRLGS